MTPETTIRHDLAFVHTANVHVENFSKLCTAIRPDVSVRHVVLEELLESARKQGIMCDEFIFEEYYV
jgi:hypothetical protein